MRVIGRKDRIDFPELGLYDIEAKIDTGAYGCALHCHHIKIKRQNGNDVLSFKVLDPTHPEYEDKVFLVHNFRDKLVKNSAGQREHRFTIQTDIIIFNRKSKLEFSLTNRKTMKNPVLLGRKFLYRRYLVDVRLKDLSYMQKK